MVLFKAVQFGLNMPIANLKYTGVWARKNPSICPNCQNGTASVFGVKLCQVVIKKTSNYRSTWLKKWKISGNSASGSNLAVASPKADLVKNQADTEKG